MHEFPNKHWSASGLDKLIKKIDDVEGTDCTNDSGRPKSMNQKIGHLRALTRILWITAFWKICHQDCINIKGLGCAIPEEIIGRKWEELPQYKNDTCIS